MPCAIHATLDLLNILNQTVMITWLFYDNLFNIQLVATYKLLLNLTFRYCKTGNFGEEKLGRILTATDEINFGKLLDIFIEKVLIWLY